MVSARWLLLWCGLGGCVFAMCGAFPLFCLFLFWSILYILYTDADFQKARDWQLSRSNVGDSTTAHTGSRKVYVVLNKCLLNRWIGGDCNADMLSFAERMWQRIRLIQDISYIVRLCVLICNSRTTSGSDLLYTSCIRKPYRNGKHK